MDDKFPSESSRGEVITRGAPAAAATAVASTSTGKTAEKTVKKVIYRNGKKPDKPMFSSTVANGNLIFIAGVGYHSEGVKVHTEHVLGIDRAAARTRGVVNGEGAEVQRRFE